MKRNKFKLAFLIFFTIALFGLVSGIAYLESASFANSVKKMISERSPQSLGVVGDFSNLKLHLFPPGIGVENPRVKVSKQNVTQIPIDGEIEAKEVRLSFAPIQMFSGLLQVSEVEVDTGKIQGKFYAGELKKQKQKKEGSKLNWQDLFQLQINGFNLKDTYLNLQTVLPGETHEELSAELVVKELILKKQKIGKRNGFVSVANVNAVKLIPPKTLKNLPIKEANHLDWNIEFTDQGLKLNPFTVDVSGVHLRLTGGVAGNLLDENNESTLEAEAFVHSDVGTFFAANLNQENCKGDVEATAKVQAKLKDIANTLKAQFSMKGTSVVWKDLHASRLSGEGALDLGIKKISLKDLEIVDQSSGPETGRVRITSSEIPFQWNDPFRAQLELENADIHWLGGTALKAVYPLEGKVTGKITAQFLTESKKSWKLRSQNDLVVHHFGLTNQKLGVSRPMFHILKPALPIKLTGGLDIGPSGLEFKEMQVRLNKTQFHVTGGISGKTGFALEARGYASLAEMDQIAENTIRGEGELNTHVHGSTEGVLLDFDPKLRDASYLGLNLGNVSGRVTYDDGISELRFTNIHASNKNTFYSVNEGFIDLSGGDDIHLPFDIHVGRVENLAEILNRLLKNVSWFPKSLIGEVHGKVDVGGKVSTPRLQITSELEGSDWTWLGERARRVKMKVGYDRGTYFAHDVSFTKTSGIIHGDVDFAAPTDEIKWSLSTEGLSSNDFDFIERLELPAKSRIEVKSEGSGKFEHLKSKTDLRVYGTEIKGEVYDPTTLSLEVGESTLRANLSVFGSKLTSQLKYALTPKQPSSFRMDLNEFDFSPALLVLNPKLLDDPEVAGLVSGRFQLDFLSTQSELARGEIQVSKYRLAKTGFTLSLVDPVNVPIQLGYFNFPSTRFRFKNSEISMGGSGKKGDIDFHIAGQADLAMAELLSSSIQKVDGKADVDFRIKGPLKDLKVNGDVGFSNARAMMRFMQTPFEELDGTIRFRQGLISVENIDAYLGEEVFSMNGRIETFTDKFPVMDLRGQFEDNKIKMAPLDLVQVRGIASIKGTQPPYQISGNLDVLQALWTKSFTQAAGGGSSRGDRFLPEAQEKEASSTLFDLDLNINAPQGFIVRNEIIDGEFKGRVKLVGPPENPRLLGEGQIVQGKVLFKDRPFIFENARIEFDDPYQLNPKFNASAIAELNQYKIRVLASGRASSWKAEFTSTPFLPENEIFSMLASGTTVVETNRYRSRDRTYVSQGEAASLILHSMDFSKDVQNKTGFQFDVEEAVNNQTANSIFAPQNTADNVASPKLVLRRRVGRNISLAFGSTVGVGNQNQKEVNAEYKLTPNVSALGVWNNTEAVSTLKTTTSTSFGLDLKFNRPFK